MIHPLLFWGALNAALAVAMGAFGAHGLKDSLEPGLLAAYQTGAQYHVFHALGLLAVGTIARFHPNRMVIGAGWLLFVGIVLFSGSLYALALSGERWLGMITPFGGTVFILGWLLLAIGVTRRPGSSSA